MELQGKTVAVLDLVSGTSKSGKAYQKREFVIETAGQYPKKVCMQLFGDKVNECPNVGEEVKVSFDAESREWNGKWFTQLNAWKVERQGMQAARQPVYQAAQPQAPATTAAPQADDLPF
jgi:hypothetical protein